MNRARAADAFVVWTLSIVLAGVFLLAGVPKLAGMETIGLQAAAMKGFPEWMRIVVGVVEVAGAIGLLIPAIAGFSAIILAVVMIPATLTQYASGEGSVYIPLVLLALLLVVAWRRHYKAVHDGYHQFADRPHPLLHDGIVAGLIGAFAIAVWFFAIDLIAGRPFFTPATLGHGLVAVLGPDDVTDSTLSFVLVYTVFHFAAFMIVGLIASLIVFLARQEPSILLGFVVLFVATEVGFYGLVGLLHQASTLGSLAWYQVMLGNLIAASAMGVYFWRTHRELSDEFRHSMDWDTELVAPEDRGNIPTSDALPAAADRAPVSK